MDSLYPYLIVLIKVSSACWVLEEMLEMSIPKTVVGTNVIWMPLLEEARLALLTGLIGEHYDHLPSINLNRLIALNC